MTLDTNSIHAAALNNKAFKHISPRSQNIWCVFGGFFCSAPVLGSSSEGPGGRSLDVSLTDPPVLDHGDDKRTDHRKEGEKMRRGREVKVKNGEKENTEERCLRSSGAGPHTTEALSSVLLASSLLHLHCSVTQD